MNNNQEYKVLVIENDGPVRESLRHTFIEQGFAVDFAATSAEGVAKVTQGEYAAVILDSRLPDGEPWMVLEMTQRKARPLPVVMMIAMGDERLALKACQLGAEDYFIKGSGLTALLPCLVTRAIERADQQQRCRQLEVGHEQWLDFYHNAPDGYFTFTVDGTLIEINDTELKRLQYTREEVVGKWRIHNLLTSNSAARLPEFLAEVAEKGTVSFEVEALRRDTTTIPIRLQIKAVTDVQSGTVIYQAMARDLSTEKQLLAQLIQAQKIDSVGRLAGGIAHDFNNLLTGILGFCSLAMRQLGKDHQTHQILQEVERAGQRAVKLVSQLLAYSRRQISKPEPLDLNQLVSETIKFIKHTLPETIKVNSRLSETIKAVKADHTQVQQVLLNLCVNARDAMSEGGELLIETGNATLDEQFTQKHLGAKAGDYAYFAVTDTGIGMNAETLARIFEPFFTTKEVGKGTGLGLAMVYGIVKSHNGYVTVDSQPGCGTTFRVYLPSCHETVKQIMTQPISTRGGCETILVAENDPIVSCLVQEVLSGYGYKVLSVTNGRDAVASYRERQGQIDLVLADVVMPEMGGIELMKELKVLDPNMRVLLSTGYSMDQDLRDFIAQGVPFIQKPYEVEDLARAVRETLDTVSAPINEAGLAHEPVHEPVPEPVPEEDACSVA